MGRFFHCRCASWHRFWLMAGVCALLLPAISRAEDPVDDLRDALKIITHIDTATKKVSEKQRKDKRDDVKTTIIPNLKTISQLRRAYLLVEWPDVGFGKELAELHARIADDLTKAIQTPPRTRTLTSRKRRTSSWPSAY